MYSPRKHSCRLARKHWSLYPAVFDGRSLPLSICDELMGILSHGCVGELCDCGSSSQEVNIDTIDRMTSSVPTLPCDIDTLQKMIEVVKTAKGTPMYCTEAKYR
jgi:hypothetical protein